MDEDLKSNSICRVCLSYNFKNELGKGLSLFEKYNDCMISNQINALANIDIQEGDGLPDRICPTCLLNLEIAYKFKLKCENNNEILLSALNNVPTQPETFDSDLPVKEEYLDDNDDDDCDYIEDNIRLACLQAASADTSQVEEIPPKPSKAIDLKLECHDCGGSFKSKCKLSVHWKKVHMPEKIKCSICLIKFKTFASLKLHKKKNMKNCTMAAMVRIEGEGRNRVFHCKDCDYKSVRIGSVTTHMRIHSGERPHQCDICHKAFTQISVLMNHKESVHQIYKAEGTCPHCGKHIKGRTKMNDHISQKHKAQPQDYPCKICNNVLKSKLTLKMHMQRHGAKLYTCEVCSNSYYTISELYTHRRWAHLKPRTKFYGCDKCNYRSRQYGAMSIHKRKHSDSNVSCNICGTFMENEKQLALHKTRHTDRHYLCQDCDKTFYSQKGLSAHTKKHCTGLLR